MTQRDPAFDCLLDTIKGFLLPFFILGAAGNPDAARAAIGELVNAYKPRTTAELDLVGRIIGFSVVAMDNLRLSMTEGLSDTKVLRYRSNAVSLNRATEQARQILQALQEQRETTRDIPRPAVAAAPAPEAAPPSSLPMLPSAAAADNPVLDIEAMKRDARMMMATFSKLGISNSGTSPIVPDPASAIRAAARAALTGTRQTPTG